MAPNFRNWISKIVYRLGASGSAIEEMAIPPDWNYQQYLRIYGQVGWLFAVNSLISEGVADVRWHLYEKDGAQQGDEVDTHPLLELWAYVNPFQTKYQYLQLTQMYLGLVGEAFWVLNFNNLGVPAEMWLAEPQYMHVIPSKKHYISHYEYRRDFGTLRLEVPEVIHMFNPCPYNIYRGLGAAQSIGVDLDSEKYAARYQNRLFYNDATPGLIIEYPDIPEDTERQKIRKEWDVIHRGWRNARKTAFLWGGAKANSIALNNKDMDFAKLREVNRDIILGAYRIPHSMLGIEGVGSRARVEADQTVFAQNVLKPALTRIREAVNEQLVPLYDDGYLFDYENPVPENREAIVDEVTKIYPVGLITREEARRKLGYDEQAASGETYVAPMTLIPQQAKGLRQFNDEQKELRWRVYANLAEREEALFKRVFKRLWTAQADTVVANFEQLHDINMAFDEEEATTEWDNTMRGVIEKVFTDNYEMATGGGELNPAHRSKQEGVLNQRALEWIAARSLTLAKMVNGTTKEELRRVLAAGFEAGDSTAKIARDIKQYYTNGFERRATLVARTEVIAASNEGAIQGYEKEGIAKAEFYAALDERICEECGALHGQEYPITQCSGVIPVHTQCRCTWVPLVE